MVSIGTYWRTIRHLKLRQILGRVVFRLVAPAPRSGALLALRRTINSPPHYAVREPTMLGSSRFRMLGEEHDLGDVGWDAPAIARLWRYNLHYFDDLNAKGGDDRRSWHSALIDRWIAENPPAVGTGWESYPTSLRIVNWIKWFRGGGQPQSAWLESLALQGRWLRRRIEWHLLGNHLFANAKALIFAGMYFEGSEAEIWRRKGELIVAAELQEQVLADGGHFERTPMYHRLVLEDILDLIHLYKSYGVSDADQLVSRLRESAASMLAWAETMQHEDGTLPRFNDTADGVALASPELRQLAAEIGIQIQWVDQQFEVLSNTGYVRRCWSNALAFLDIGEVGPGYLPGHAHADTLSFELAVRGRQLVVNRGTSCYGESPRRTYERSTAAHSTLEVADESSSEVWGGFRVGRRAMPRVLKISKDEIECSHDGYRHLPRGPVHARNWRFAVDGLVIEDKVAPDVPAVARFHFAPGIGLRQLSSRSWQLIEGSEIRAQMDFGSGEARVVWSEQAIAFGQLTPAETLEVNVVKGRLSTRFAW